MRNKIIVVAIAALALLFTFWKFDKAKPSTKPAQEVAAETPPPAAINQPLPPTEENLEAPPPTPVAPAPKPTTVATKEEPLPTSDEDLDYLALSLDYFEPHVFPKLSALPSPCLAICNPSTYNQELIYTGQPEYEIDFYKYAPDKAFNDPEFRIRAEKLRAISTWNDPAYRKFRKDAFTRSDGMREEEREAYEKTIMPRFEAHFAKSKALRPQFHVLMEVIRKYRDLRDECGSESPDVIQQQCLKLLAPTGQFPQIKE